MVHNVNNRSKQNNKNERTMRKELGGSRLGAGKGMSINIPQRGRTTHNLSRVWRSSATTGTCIPFLTEIVMDGDTVDLDLSTHVRTLPTVGPLFGSFKLQLDVFEIPMRLYMKELHNAKFDIGRRMQQMAFPYVMAGGEAPNPSVSDPNQAQINPSALSAYLGLRGLGSPETLGTTFVTRKVQALPWLMYADIYKNYYANKQEKVGALIGATEAVVNSEILGYQWIQGDFTEENATNVISTWPAAATDTSEVVAAMTGGSAAHYLRIFATGQTPFRDMDHLYVPIYEDYNAATPDVTKLIDILPDVLAHPDKVSINDTQTRLNIRTDALDSIAGLVNTGMITVGKANSAWVSQVNGYIGREAATDWHPGVTTFPLTAIDDMRESLLSNSAMTGGVDITTIGGWTEFLQYMVPRSNQQGGSTEVSAQTVPNGGLMLKTYQSDRFNAWLDAEAFDLAQGGQFSVDYQTNINVQGGFLNMDTLNMVQKLYNLLNRVQATGNSYEDWREATWGGQVTRRYETPMFIGGMSAEIVFDEVVSTAQTGGAGLGENGALGSIGGRGRDQAHKGGRIKKRIEEPGFIIGIVSITPRIDYTNGNKWHMQLNTIDDLHKPDFDGIGFQDLVTDEMAAWDTTLDSNGNPTYNAVGKQPAWTEYTTAVNESYGDFAIDERGQFMTLSRRYRPGAAAAGQQRVLDLTTIIDPNKFNFAFANREPNAQNFWVQIGIDLKMRRKMSAQIMPIL